MTNSLIIHGCKDYQTDTEKKIKGIRKNAKQLLPNVFLQEQWLGLKGGIRRGILNEVHIKKQIKVLSRIYTKGVVGSSGEVSPLVLDL